MTTPGFCSPKPWRLSAVQTAALVRGRQLSATEVARAALARVEAVNPALLNAIAECRPEVALAQAAALDAALARGDAPGPLAGVPVTIKVNVDQAGHATTNGVRLQKRTGSPRTMRPCARPARGRRAAAGAHQHTRLQLPLVHQQPAARPHAQPAQCHAHAGRLLGRRGQQRGGGPGRAGARHRHRRLGALPGLRLRRARPAAQLRPHRQLQRHGAEGPHHRRAVDGRLGPAGAPRARPAPGPARHGRRPTRATPGRCRPRCRPRAAAPRRRACGRTAWTPRPRSAPRCCKRPSSCATPAGWWTRWTGCRRWRRRCRCRSRCGWATATRPRWPPPRARVTPAPSPRWRGSGTTRAPSACRNIPRRWCSA